MKQPKEKEDELEKFVQKWIDMILENPEEYIHWITVHYFGALAFIDRIGLQKNFRNWIHKEEFYKDAMKIIKEERKKEKSVKKE